MIVHFFSFHGRSYVVTGAGNLYMVDMNGSDLPCDWTYTLVTVLP